MAETIGPRGARSAKGDTGRTGRTGEPGEPGATGPHADETLRDALIAGLVGTASEISQGLQDVAEAQRDLVKAASLTRLQRWFLGVVLVLGTIGAVSASIDGVFILKGQSETHANTKAIKDCTTPGGQCYERGQQQTGQAVAILQKYILIAADCARQPGDSQAFAACVQSEAKAQGLVK